MELKWLEDFVMLASTPSFSRAAEARHVTIVDTAQVAARAR